MKNSLWLLLAAMMMSLLATSCEEKTEESKYANWQERNQRFIDSIAAVAEDNADGNWRIYKSWRLPADNPNDLTATKHVNNYVYCHIEQSGSGTVTPIYTDSIRANYRVWFMTGELLDQSFKGEFNPAISVPAEFAMAGMIDGWTTAVQHMHAGDIWTVYMPYKLAYGIEQTGSVPGYSALKYWINLVEVYPTGTPLPEWQ